MSEQPPPPQPPQPAAVPPPPPPAQFVPGAVVVTAAPTNPKAVAALVLGIVGVVTGWCFGVGLVCGILAIIFGHLGKKDVEASGGAQTGRGLAQAGFILGIVGTAIWLLFWGFYIVLVVFAVSHSFNHSFPFMTPAP